MNLARCVTASGGLCMNTMRWGCCQSCQTPLPEPKYNGRGTKRVWCSQTCKKRFQRHGNHEGSLRACEVCGVDFRGRVDKKYCSPTCLHRKNNLNRPPAACPECGKECNPKRMSDKYCSAKCRQRVDRRKRRALEASSYTEDVFVSDLIERDGTDCSLCGQPIDMSLVCPDLGAPTLDHVVPLSHGGLHEAKNLKLAHYSCNSRKGNRV